MTDFCDEYPRLEPAQRERFRRLVTRLLAGQILTPGAALAPDPDWRFAERHRDLVDDYLRIGGWRFDFDAALRLARAVHIAGEQRVRFNKLESTLLCLLRLAWHEAMRHADDDVRCTITIGDARERLLQAGRPMSQLSRRALADAVRRLERHAIVSTRKGFVGADVDVVTIQAVIESIFPADRVNDIAQRLKSYARGGAVSGDDTDDTDDGGDSDDGGDGGRDHPDDDDRGGAVQ